MMRSVRNLLRLVPMSWPRTAGTPLRFALLIAWLLFTGARPAIAAEPPLTLVRAPELQQRLESERGRVVILNLWGTWCVPCLREIPPSCLRVRIIPQVLPLRIVHFRRLKSPVLAATLPPPPLLVRLFTFAFKFSMQ